MAHDEFQFQDLVDALEMERGSKTITKIDRDFFKEMREFILELEEEVTKNSQNINTLDRIGLDHLLKAKKMAEDLLNRRLKKIALAAVHQEMGIEKVDTSNMTERENELFHDIKDLLDETKGELRDGGYRRHKQEVVPDPPAAVQEEKEEKPKKAVKVTPDDKLEEILVHVIDDVPTFVDMETTYTLKKEDVITLRADLAKVLISRELAREVVLT